jgi:hypothetical protein
MIDAWRICVATAAKERVEAEADIYRFVICHSIALAAIMGMIVLLEAYLYPFTAMVPHHVGIITGLPIRRPPASAFYRIASCVHRHRIVPK